MVRMHESEVPATSSQQLVDELRDGFGLPPVERWSDIQVGWTTNVLLESGTIRLVARIHRNSTSLERLLAMQAARTALADGGVPTVRPIQARDGATSMRLTSGRLAELEEFVEWDTKMNTTPLLRTGHALLAKMHDVLRATRLPAAADDMPDANYISSEDALVSTRRGAERMLGWHNSQLSDYARDVVTHIEAVASAEEPLRDQQLIQHTHGDFWDNNVLFVGDEPALLLDFDFLARRPRIDDLALTAFFYLLKPGQGVPSDGERHDLRSFLDAYDASASIPLAPGERAAFPLAIARQPAWSVGGWVLKYDEERAFAHAIEAASEFHVAKAILDNLDEWQQDMTASQSM